MKRLVLLLPLLGLAAASARAQDPATNAMPSMARWILSEKESVRPYGWGLDIGRSFDRFDGLQLLVGSDEVLDGAQIGIVMTAVESRGIQIGGLAAASERSAGLQAGLFGSMAETSLDGVQLGGVAACIGPGTDKGSKLGNGEPHTPASHGIQAAIFYAMADRFKGVQTAALQASAWEIGGVQASHYRAEAWEIGGVQASAFNHVEADLSGLQLGLFNTAGELHGLQVGLYNRARGGAGVQIGLVNGFGPPGDALWLPIVNARF